MLVGGVSGLFDEQPGGRRLELVVVQGGLAGGQAALRYPVVEMLLVAPVLAGQRIIGAMAARDRVATGNRVEKDQLVGAVGVLEHVADAVMLHQPAHEGHVALAILHRVFELGIGLAQPRLVETRQAGMLAEDQRDDLGRGLVVEDQAVAALRQHPQPGAQHQPVEEPAVADAHPLDLGQDTVEIALAIVDRVHHERAMLADRAVEVDVLARTQRLDAIFERLADPFHPVEPHQDQRVLAQRSLQFADARILPVGSCHPKKFPPLDWIGTRFPSIHTTV